MKITYLLGSGVSLPSGLQGVQDITNALFEESFFEHTDQSIIQGKHPSEYLRDEYDVKPIQEFLALIREKYDKYLTRKLGLQHKSSYEDLYYIVDQVHVERTGHSDNLAIFPFLQEIEDLSFPYRHAYKKWGQNKPIPIADFCKKSKVLIETVIKYGLWEREPQGFDHLLDLLKDSSTTGLEIFTLNHDLLLEKYFEQNEIQYSDGFSRPDREVRWYEPELFDSGNPVNIYHLHGAKNWSLVRDNDGSKYINRYAILLGREKWHNKKRDGNEVQLLFDDGNLLTGANKSDSYLFGIFGELFFRINVQLRSTSRLIASGYGWNDYAINRLIFEWLNKSDENKLLLIHREPDKLINNSRHVFEGTFNEYIKVGKIVVLEKWFEEVEKDEILNFYS